MNIDRQPNMHDLSWFIDMDRQQRLDLDPPYQRLSVWTNSDRFYFLDTVFNNYPCPAVYVQKEINTSGPTYNVVDGKQRLATILNFYKNKIRLPKSFTIARLAGKRFRDLEQQDVFAFYNYVFLVETLKASGDADWNEVFFRVNKNQKRLTDQELRHARYDGWLVTRAEKEAADDGASSSPFWRRMRVSTLARSRRMKDVEFISTLMLILLERDFVGFPQANINELYAKYDFDPASLPLDDEEALALLEDEALDGADAEDGSEGPMTTKGIVEFERTFAQVKEYVAAMEDHNACITRHAKRLTTDFYSLWALLGLTETMASLEPPVLAERYDAFLDDVDRLFESQGVGGGTFDPRAALYYGNSIGAGTTAVARRHRHEALLALVEERA